MEGRRRKPFLLLDGAPLLLHTLLRLRAARGCGQIVLAAHPDDLRRLRQRWAKYLKAELGVTAIVPGGPTRQQSVLAALDATGPDPPLVLIHDAVRPLVHVDLIEKVARRAADCGAAIAAVPAVATIKEVDPEGVVRSTPDRHRLWLAQTPQAFCRQLILEAHRRARDDGFVGTDDSLLVERIGHKVVVVEDCPDNIKITTGEDLIVAEALLRRQRDRGVRGADLSLPALPSL